MIFTETSIPGAYCIDLEPLKDNRGFFARTWCTKEFREHDLNPNLVQCNLSYNAKRGTLRGMHYQRTPYEEAKLISCIIGTIYDMILDLRQHSPAFGRWQAVELSAANHRMLYIPEGVAHGFQTLQDDSSVFYQMSGFYHPESTCGVRWDDPSFCMEWPITDKIMSAKDQTYGWWSD
jgi:dTDP-4-dehydrorhamnose 3,5-epimerase